MYDSLYKERIEIKTREVSISRRTRLLFKYNSITGILRPVYPKKILMFPSNQVIFSSLLGTIFP